MVFLWFSTIACMFTRGYQLVIGKFPWSSEQAAVSDAWPGGDFERWIFWSLDVGRFQGSQGGTQKCEKYRENVGKYIGNMWEIYIENICEKYIGNI